MKVRKSYVINRILTRLWRKLAATLCFCNSYGLFLFALQCIIFKATQITSLLVHKPFWKGRFRTVYVDTLLRHIAGKSSFQVRCSVLTGYYGQLTFFRSSLCTWATFTQLSTNISSNSEMLPNYTLINTKKYVTLDSPIPLHDWRNVNNWRNIIKRISEIPTEIGLTDASWVKNFKFKRSSFFKASWLVMLHFKINKLHESIIRNKAWV